MQVKGLKGNRVKIPDCPAAVSRIFTGKRHATEIIGKAFATGRQSQKTCLLQESTQSTLGMG